MEHSKSIIWPIGEKLIGSAFVNDENIWGCKYRYRILQFETMDVWFVEEFEDHKLSFPHDYSVSFRLMPKGIVPKEVNSDMFDLKLVGFKEKEDDQH